MTAVGKVYENGYAERLMRTIKEEEVDLSEYRNFSEVNERIEVFLEEIYMKKRIHSSLSYLTPSKFEEKWMCERKDSGGRGLTKQKDWIGYQYAAYPHTRH